MNEEKTNVETKESETKVVTKKQTWLNRIWSAIVGAIIAVGAMFGITTDKVAEEKAKVETVQTQAKEALEAIKAGDITTATQKLTEATTAVKEVVNGVKEAAANVKEQAKDTDKKEIGKTAIKGAIENLVKNNVKNAEAATKAYTE